MFFLNIATKKSMGQPGYWKLIHHSLALQAVDINTINFPHLLCYDVLFGV